LKRIFLILIILMFSQTAFCEEQLTVATKIVENAKKECLNYNAGAFESTERTITLHDFTGDGRPEEIIDASQFSCSTSVSMWTGSAGTLLWIIVDEKTYEFRAYKWWVVDLDEQKVLLLAVDSSECSNSLGPCYRALVWQDGFRTTRKP